MIRFIDMRDDDEDDPTPVCSFIQTVTDTFIESTNGSHEFVDLSEVEEVLGPRGVRLVPKGFF